MKVLAIAAHPDDETLGCGGALLKHRADGDALSWLIASKAHDPEWPAQVADRKQEEIAGVAEAYGMQQHIQLDYPAGQLDHIPQLDLIDKIREVVFDMAPEVIYLVHGGDVHTDHRVVFTATMSSVKLFQSLSAGVRRILCYETLSSTEASLTGVPPIFLPHVLTDITPYIDQKLSVMARYETEQQADPLPRGPSAIRALARYRGAAIGVEYAEAFMVIREIN